MYLIFSCLNYYKLIVLLNSSYKLYNLKEIIMKTWKLLQPIQTIQTNQLEYEDSDDECLFDPNYKYTCSDDTCYTKP